MSSGRCHFCDSPRGAFKYLRVPVEKFMGELFLTSHGTAYFCAHVSCLRQKLLEGQDGGFWGNCVSVPREEYDVQSVLTS